MSAEVNLLHALFQMNSGVFFLSGFSSMSVRSVGQPGAWQYWGELLSPLSVCEEEIHFSRPGEEASSSAVTISIKGLWMVIMFTYQQSD